MLNFKFKEKIYKLNYLIKYFILLLSDQLILNISFFYLSLLTKEIYSFELYLYQNLIFLLINLISKHNLSVLRFLEINYYIKTLVFIGNYSIFAYFINLYFSIDANIYLITVSTFLYLSISILRFVIFFIIKEDSEKKKINIILYGSGKVASYFLSQNNSLKVCAIIDDDFSKNGRLLKGIEIFHSSKLEYLIKKYDCSKVIIAINNLDSLKKFSIIEKITYHNVSVNFIESIENHISNKITNFELRKIKFDDLVNRNVNWNTKEIKKLIYSKVILITGAGGTIGSALAMFITSFRPKKLILLDHSEYLLYQLSKKINEIPNLEKNTSLSFVTSSVRIENDLLKVFENNNIDNIFHTAAYKHVPIQEENPYECLDNNVISTYLLAKLANKKNIKNFILISSDKAVRPTNYMGASKRLAEIVVQSFSLISKKTTFSMVRFGNVIGSSGSAFPLFLNQIYENKQITITHPKVTRYFMTSKEAVGLILESAHMAKGGEVFLLNMGDPIKILDLAKKMIKLMGYSLKNKRNPNGDISIKFIGLRPGEKLYEELLISNSSYETNNIDIFTAREKSIPYQEMMMLIKKLKKFLTNNNLDEINKLLYSYVDGFKK